MVYHNIVWDDSGILRYPAPAAEAIVISHSDESALNTILTGNSSCVQGGNRRMVFVRRSWFLDEFALGKAMIYRALDVLDIGLGLFWSLLYLLGVLGRFFLKC